MFTSMKLEPFCRMLAWGPISSTSKGVQDMREEQEREEEEEKKKKGKKRKKKKKGKKKKKKVNGPLLVSHKNVQVDARKNCSNHRFLKFLDGV